MHDYAAIFFRWFLMGFFGGLGYCLISTLWRLIVKA